MLHEAAAKMRTVPGMSSRAELRSEVRDHVLEVVLDRPEKRNAFTEAMYRGLVRAFEDASQNDEVRVLLLRGEGEHFAAGNDLGDFLARPPTGTDAPVFEFLQALASFGKPLVVAVDGAAIGLGTTLLLHADWVVATPRARLQLPFVDLGLVPEAGATLLLPLTVGRLRAQRWLLSGEPIPTSEALAAGLVSELVAPEALLDHVRAVCTKLSKKPPEALRHTKALTRAPFREALERALREEAEVFLRRLGADDTKARFAAFLAKKG